MLGSKLSKAGSVLRANSHIHARCMSNALAAPETEPSLIDKIFNRSKMPQVPLDVPFPNLPTLHSKDPVEYPTEMTTLDNGMRVVSCESNTPVSSVATFVDSGSRYETFATCGISHFLEFIAFKSTENRTDFRLVREMLKDGTNIMCSTSREHTVYAGDGLRQSVPAIVNTLADVLQYPEFDKQELEEARAQYLEAANERQSAPDVQIMEGIHAAAYHNNTLGLPLYAPPHTVASFNKDVLKAHMTTFYTPSRMVVSGVGVDHKELVELVSKEFKDLPSEPTPLQPKAQYTGGDIRLVNNNEPMSHVALAFETANWHSDDLVPLCVLQIMMGGGGSFSAGGPGKGMYSRLYQNVLARQTCVESANSFTSIFTDSAIFGMYGTSAPGDASTTVDLLCAEMTNMAGKVTDGELSRAKNQLKSSVHMQLENRSLKLEDIGRQVMTYGKVMSATDLCQKIEAVGASDIQRVASAMLKMPLSVAAYGNLCDVPRYDDIAKRFG